VGKGIMSDIVMPLATYPAAATAVNAVGLAGGDRPKRDEQRDCPASSGFPGAGREAAVILAIDGRAGDS
jgi:hypothetical protein